MADADRVLIIGAGVAGLTAAVALRRAGIEPTVFERSGELREIGSGLGVQYGAVKALRRIGLFDDLRAIGQPLERMEMATSGGMRLASIPHDELAKKLGVQTLNVHRGEMLNLLVREVGPERIVVGANCVSFEEDDQGVTARFADGREERGSVLVAADGNRSTLAKFILADGDPRDSGIIVWRAMPHFEHPDLPLGVLRQLFGRAKFFSMVPGTQARVFFFAGGIVSEFGTEPATDPKQEVLGAFGEWEDAVAGVVQACQDGEVVRTRVFDRPPAERWSTRRVTLAGDAAHPMVPTLGQGASTGIEDAVALAKHLSQAGGLADAAAVQSALRAYETERIARTTPLVVTARRFARIVMSPNPLMTLVRNVMMRASPARSWQRRLEAQHSYEV